ncbi:MAG TPA: cupin domain-containing protein [Rhodoblastus sp.]|nr:cupin domain-containing protein [Rhodoblastus sp.]
MLTRRGFAGLVAGCAICEITATSFIATDASAQGAPAATAGLNRKLLSRMDGPMAGYETVTMEVEIEPNVMIGRHTHPGIEAGYVVSGEIDLPIEGQGVKKLKAGDGFQVPPNTPHAGAKNGAGKVKLVSTYIVEKGKPLASPA